MRNALKTVLLTGFVALAVPGALIAAEATGTGSGSTASPGASGSDAKPKGDSECDYNSALAQKESGGVAGGGYSARNGQFKGKYQMGNDALEQVGYKDSNGRWKGIDGIHTDKDWNNRPDVQEKVQGLWNAELDRQARSINAPGGGKLADLVGKPLPGGGPVLTKEGLRAGMHLIGGGGVQAFYGSGGVCSKTPIAGAPGGKRHRTADGNGTCFKDYAASIGSCKAIEKDMSKKTCDVTMPMIEAIDCSKFPAGELQNLCNYARPALMTRAECNAAESWAERAPKGPQKESCEGQTFGPGTGSWSYVLACSYMDEYVAGSKASADNDGVANGTSTGPSTDPECIQKLRETGLQFKELGQWTHSGKIGTCTVENAVSITGGTTSVKWKGTLVMRCELARPLEEWTKKIRAMGVESFGELSTTNGGCRNQRDDNGTHNRPSEHGVGRAIDIGLFGIMGEQVNMTAIRGPRTAAQAIAVQAMDASCAFFKRVLSPSYPEYKTMTHTHYEVAGRGNCWVSTKRPTSG